MKHFSKFFIAFSLVAALGFIRPQSAFACSCTTGNAVPDWTLANFQGSVFTGTVLDIPTNQNITTNGELRVSFQVKDGFKNASTNIITLYTPAGVGACRYNFEVGQEYLVYAQERDGELTTNLCSGNKPVSEASYDITQLKNTPQTLVVTDVANNFPLKYLYIGMGVVTAIIVVLLASLAFPHKRKAQK